MLINADAYSWIKEQPDNSVDAIITDPMYDDEFDVSEFIRVCRGNIVMFCSPYNRYFLPDKIHHWVKQPSTKNTTKEMSDFVEEILVLRRGVYNHNLQWANYVGVFHDIVDGEVVHPFQKPLSLMERLVKIYTKEGDTVLDPFCGSGQTLRACLNNGRNFIGIDNDPKWIEYCQRYEKEFA